MSIGHRRKRAKRFRRLLKRNGVQSPRMVVSFSNKHIRAQIVDVHGKVLAYVSTLQKELLGDLPPKSNVEMAGLMGRLLAEQAVRAGVDIAGGVVFDRSGFAYHGKVKKLADAAREAGVNM